MACGIPPDQFVPLDRRGADYRFLIFPPGELAGVSISDAVRNHKNILDVAVTSEIGDQIQPLRTTSDRAGFVVAVGDRREDAVCLANWACGQIAAEYPCGQTAHPYTLGSFGETVH
jgi:hypothetical protein